MICLKPERLQGNHYSIASDIWSLGLSLVEMALGRYPVPPLPHQLLKDMFGDLYDIEKDRKARQEHYRRYHEQEDNGNGEENITPSSYDTNMTAPGSGNNSNDFAPNLSIFALLDYIVHEPPPTLPVGVFSEEFKYFIDRCLQKNPLHRPDLMQLMVDLIFFDFTSLIFISFQL